MNAERIAICTIWGIITLVYIVLSIILIRYSAKHREKSILYVAISMILSIFISILSPIVLKPVSAMMDNVVGNATGQLTMVIEQLWPETGELVPAQGGETKAPGESGSAPPDNDRVIRVENGRNSLVYHSAIPLENRACVPENSLYPDVTMETVLSLTSGFPSTPGYQGKRRDFSGGVTYAFTAPVSDPSGLYEELKLEILKNPLVGDMIIQCLAEVYPDFEAKSSMKEFLFACNNAFIRSETPTGMEAWLTGYEFPDGQIGIYVTNSYRLYAETICQFLDTCTNYGVQELPYMAYYSRNLSVTYDNMRTEAITITKKPLAISALVLYKTDDSGNVVFTIGFDLDDKGLLLYNPNII